MPTSHAQPSIKERREAARVAAERLREARRLRRRRQRLIGLGAGVVGLALVAVLIAWIMAEANRSVLEDVALRPQGSTLSGAIAVGSEGIAGTTEEAASDAVVVSVYSDYMCPYCALFEELNGPVLDELREAGDVVVQYHPVSIMDRVSEGTAYSTRAAVAAALVADRAPEHFLAFNRLLFANQPAEGTTGLTNAEIADLARQAEVPQDVASAIESGDYVGDRSGAGGSAIAQTFLPWVEAATEQASRDLGQLSTPTILIAGVELGADWRQDGVLAQAVADASP